MIAQNIDSIGVAGKILSLKGKALTNWMRAGSTISIIRNGRGEYANYLSAILTASFLEIMRFPQIWGLDKISAYPCAIPLVRASSTLSRSFDR